MVETQFSAGAVQLSALDNQGQGPIVLGIHGFLDNAESLNVLAPFLTSYHFIALDLAGHGRSSHRSEGAHYNQADYLQDLHALITGQGWDDVILVGHSLGGILATMFAALFPEKVRGVVSIDACGPLVEPEESTQEQMRNAILSRHGKTTSASRAIDLDEMVKMRCKVTDMSASDARIILQRSVKQNGEGQDVWSSDSRLRTKSVLRLTEKQAENLMRAIECPLLFIGASNSFKQLDKMFPRRARWFKNAQYEQLVGGHHIHMENTGDVGRLICQFVEQL